MVSNSEKNDDNPSDGHGGQGPGGGGGPIPKKFEIQIDRTVYAVTQEHMTGAEIRRVPSPPIGPDRDLFEVVPGGSDKKIEDQTVVEIRNGLRFFTAPAHINPGAQ